MIESERFVQLSSPCQGVALSFSDSVLSRLQSVLKDAPGSQQNRRVFFFRRQTPLPADTGAPPFPFPSVRLLRKFLSWGHSFSSILAKGRAKVSR